jgi:membrane-bound lytic murein transglycosylase B
VDDTIRAHPNPRPHLPPLRAVLRLALALAVLAAMAPIADAADAKAGVHGGYARRTDVRAFIDEMVAGDGYDRAALERAFRDARFQPKIVAAMDRPIVEPPKWYEYAPPFLSPERIDGGVAWWNAHASELARAESRYGVPPEIVVAIVGIETFYGRITGRYRALDALATLAFDYPRRAAFFRGELREFLLLAREQRIAPASVTGSFAGALGVPQFMPGSYRAYAVDFDGDGRTDLWGSAADVIGSIAAFLARHDWKRGQPVLLPAVIAPDALGAARRKLDGGISERRTLDAWAADGVDAADAPPDLEPDPVALLMLEERDGSGAEGASYRIACQNFYVLTRYNRSRLYAAAVHALAQAIKAAR